MKRRKPRRLTQKGKRFTCAVCSKCMLSKLHFTQHILNNDACKSSHPHNCKTCDFVGHNEYSLYVHLENTVACQYFDKQKGVASGLLKPITSECVTMNKSIPHTTSHVFNRYSTDGILDKVQLNIHDDTIQKRVNVRTFSDSIMKDGNIQSYMSNSRTLAGVQENNFSSTFHLEENHNRVDNEFYVSDNQQGCHIIDIHNEDVAINQILVIEPNAANENVLVNENAHNALLNNDGVVDIRSQQETLNKRFDALTFSAADEMEIDLFHMLKASNAPLILFDRVIHWLQRHESVVRNNGTELLMKRVTFLQDLNNKLYGKQVLMKPHVDNILLSSGRNTNVVTFSFKEMVLRMVLNKSLFSPSNLLLNPLDPCSPPIESEYIGEVNTGTWMKNAIRKECTLPNHILMPFCHFIDGLNIDKYGKLTVEAVLTCCLWFNRKARNRSSTWWVHGFVQDQKLFRDQKNYIRNDKAQDYHDMMSKIFNEMRLIRESGGIKLTLDFGNDNTHDVIAIPVVQFIIGDCKGNDLLCGRKGGHGLTMKGLCRDCDVSPDNGDNTCIDTELICSFHRKENIEGKETDELNQWSFLPINNCFHNISFGGCDRNIYGATPAEILHAVLLGLCEYIAEGMDMIFTQSALDSISYFIVGIFEDSKRQSERDLPDIGPFRNGLMSVKSLKAKERFARVYCLFLALSNSHLIDLLCTKKRKKRTGEENTPNLSTDYLRGYYGVIVETLLFHLWLKKDNYLKSDLEIDTGNVDSRAMKRIKHYLEHFKAQIIRGGNNLKTPKFHQMLHVVDYIERHGCPMNYDGSRGENFGKLKIKDNARLTNKQKDTLNFDIGRRISEEDVVDQVSSVYHNNMGSWPSTFCNETDIALNANRQQTQAHNNTELTNTRESLYPRFKMKVNIEYNDNDVVGENVNVHIDWGGDSKTPLLNFPNEILKKVAHRLYIGSAHIGGKVSSNSVVMGYTEIMKDGILYRSHPCYAKKGCWYDWAYFNWDGFDKPIAARIMMIIDLSECDIIHTMDQDPDTIPNDASDRIIHHLTNEKWVVLLASQSPEVLPDQLTNNHFDSQILKRIKLHNDNDLWIVPLSTIVGPCFVVYNKNYGNPENINGNQGEATAYIIEPMKNWGEAFLPLRSV